MKKAFLTLALISLLAACSKQHDDPAMTSEPTENFFSKVRRYKDGRTPPVDTVWRLTLFTQSMVDSFARYNGYIYTETTTFTEVGVLWSR